MQSDSDNAGPALLLLDHVKYLLKNLSSKFPDISTRGDWFYEGAGCATKAGSGPGEVAIMDPLEPKLNVEIFSDNDSDAENPGY